MTQRSQLWRRLATLILAQLLSLFAISFVSADNDKCTVDNPRVGYFVSKTDNVKVFGNGQSAPRAYNTAISDYSDDNTKRYLCEGDTIQTGLDSNAAIELFNLTQPNSPNIAITIESNSVFTIDNPAAILAPPRTIPKVQKVSTSAFTSFDSTIEYCQQTINRAWLFLKQGAIHIFTKEPQSLNVNTPYLNASVEGTEFTVVVGADQVDGQNLGSNTTLVSVLDGKVGVCNNKGVGKLNRNEAAFAREGTAPELIKVRPDNAVHWALYYPRLNTDQVDPNPIAIATYDLLIQGNVDQAQNELAGQTDDFSQALNATIAVTQNRRDDALDIANQALINYPDSASLLLAKSYAQQSKFDLKGALESVEKASIEDPESIIILTRLAELQQINGNTKEALVSANRAVQADDQISRTHTVLGFIKLSQFDIDEAKDAFNQAIAIDEYDPLPRLGLGLSLIRKNQLEAGLDSMANAVILDPLDSILRSYFGKTYAELNESEQALEQYQLAEQYDPKDPTPYLYRAFLYQSINQPTKALANLQRSIEENDNRAVYRSSPNLDEDLAVRSASAARIYEELGFDQLTVLEGAKSLAHDPGNYSAHRLMADAYLNRPRHEIARVSELLQSQIRQPLNNNPAQVQLADSRLGAFRDSGPFDVSFNEFSRLYTKEGFSGRVGLVVGENNTHGEEVQVSALKGRTSFTVTGYNFETDGERINADEDNQLFNIFAQYKVTDRFNIQAEYRNIDIDRGETFRGFDPEDFDPNIRIIEDVDSYRISSIYRFSNSRELLFNYRNEEFDQSILNIDFEAFEEFDEFFVVDSDLYEGQYFDSSTPVKFILGAGLVKQDREEVFPDGTDDSVSLDIEHKNYYGYAYPSWKISDHSQLDLTIGLSKDDFDDIDLGTTQTNPKFGVSWTYKNLTTRAAYFETLKRTLVADQTLEPTNVAGFNQFFDDFDATKTELYGLGLDYSFYLTKGLNDLFSASKVYVGLETFKRDINVPGFIFDFEVDDFTLQREDLSEKFTNLYAYIPFENWSFGVNFEKETFDRKFLFELSEQIIDLTTKRVKFNLTYFHPKGFRFSLQPIYVEQDGDFINRFFEEFSGDDDFWIVNTSFGYRFNYLDALLSLEVNNLLDKDFNYQDTDPFNSRYSRGRSLFLTAKIAF